MIEMDKLPEGVPTLEEYLKTAILDACGWVWIPPEVIEKMTPEQRMEEAKKNLEYITGRAVSKPGKIEMHQEKEFNPWGDIGITIDPIRRGFDMRKEGGFAAGFCHAYPYYTGMLGGIKLL